MPKMETAAYNTFYSQKTLWDSNTLVSPIRPPIQPKQGPNLESPGKINSTDELCNLCRNLNLRIESFTDYNWRHPSSFESRVFVRRGKLELKDGEFLDHVTGQCQYIVTPPILHDQVVYTDEFMGQFKREDTVDSSGRESWCAPMITKSLGRFEDIVLRAESCSLCSLIADVPKRFGFMLENVQSVLGSYTCKLSFLWNESGEQSSSTQASHRSMSRNVCTLNFAGLNFELIPVIDNGDASWMGGRARIEEGVNAAQIQCWLESCLQYHGELCNSPPWLDHLLQLPTLRMIDVEQGCLVKIQAQCPYVALSYVWGRDLQFKCTNSLLPSLEVKFGLVRHWEQIPRTIQDVVKLIRLVGLRYLWVDSLCIVQDSQADMQDQVTKMGHIYGNALLTIVAADGDDAGTGLFNINTASRVGRQCIRYSKDLKLLVGPPSLEAILRETRWATRGWTFQEALLSKRLLVFVDQTVYFSCQSTTWSEQRKAYSETVPPPWTWAEAPSPYAFEFEGPMTRRWSEMASSLQIYYPNLQSWFVASTWQSLVNEYSTRTLSYGSDVLAAIAGVQEVFGRFFPYEILYGMPLSIIQTALLWHPRVSLKRRKDGKKHLLPSWTWTAWIGEVDWQHDADYIRIDVGSEIDLPMSEDEALIELASRESESQASSLPCSTPRESAKDITFWLVDQAKKSRTEIARTSYESPQFRDASWPHVDYKRSASYHFMMAVRGDFAVKYYRQRSSVHKRGSKFSRSRHIPDERSNLSDCGTSVPDSWKLLCIRTQCRRFFVAPLEFDGLEGIDIMTYIRQWYAFANSEAGDCSEEVGDTRLYAVLDQQQVRCGAVRLSTQDYETLAIVDGCGLFIAISGPHYLAKQSSEPDQFDRERYDRLDADYFEVMMIGVKGKFAERVAVGRIYAHAWNWTDGKLEEYTLI